MEGSSDRQYQFISDPAHKENLSGRVTAACLNCRRKKVKCSGESDCIQCQEKGLQCDGPTSRKRPKREYDPSTSNEASSSSSTQQEKFSLHLPLSVLHEDSGYHSQLRTPSSIGSQYNGSETPTAAIQERAADTLHSLQHRRDPTHSAASGQTDGHYGSFSSSQVAASPTYTTSSEDPGLGQASRWAFTPSTSGPGTSVQNYDISDATASLSSYDSPEQRGSSEGWWSSASHGQEVQASHQDLIHAAEALEGQARDLRWLASRHQSIDMGSQQQTAQFTATTTPHSSQTHGRSDIAQLPVGSMASTNVYNAQSWMYRPDGSLRSGFTSSDHEYTSYLRQELDRQGTHDGYTKTDAEPSPSDRKPASALR